MAFVKYQLYKNNIYRFYKDIRLLLYYKIICSKRFKKKNNKRILYGGETYR